MKSGINFFSQTFYLYAQLTQVSSEKQTQTRETEKIKKYLFSSLPHYSSHFIEWVLGMKMEILFT